MSQPESHFALQISFVVISRYTFQQKNAIKTKTAAKAPQHRFLFLFNSLKSTQ